MIEPRYVVAKRVTFVNWCYEQGIDPRDRSKVVRVSQISDAQGVRLESIKQIVWLDGPIYVHRALCARVWLGQQT